MVLLFIIKPRQLHNTVNYMQARMTTLALERQVSCGSYQTWHGSTYFLSWRVHDIQKECPSLKKRSILRLPTLGLTPQRECNQFLKIVSYQDHACIRSFIPTIFIRCCIRCCSFWFVRCVHSFRCSPKFVARWNVSCMGVSNPNAHGGNT
jgi:hypothetical protein